MSRIGDAMKRAGASGANDGFEPFATNDVFSETGPDRAPAGPTGEPETGGQQFPSLTTFVPAREFVDPDGDPADVLLDAGDAPVAADALVAGDVPPGGQAYA